MTRPILAAAIVSSMAATASGQGLIPVAIEVDAQGNSVLEPGETAAIVPTWRNQSAGSVVGGPSFLTNFSGPAGATYSIVDGNGSYPFWPPLSPPQSCTDCYSVRVTASARPVTHWDATALESVIVWQKVWTLHVGATFTDVPVGSGFYRFVEAIVHKNVTSGCSATEYCPTADTTRDAMAVFVLVSRELAGYVPPACGATPMFADVPVTSGFCRWVEELARRGVVSGCAPNLYCPTAPATREQMAVFVLRTLDPTLNPPACVTGSEVFADVPASNGFCRWIEELARRGVVTGCGGGNPCPAAAVTREQMSVFLTVTFRLTIYGI
jgi:S-layer homology domain